VLATLYPFGYHEALRAPGPPDAGCAGRGGPTARTSAHGLHVGGARNRSGPLFSGMAGCGNHHRDGSRASSGREPAQAGSFAKPSSRPRSSRPSTPRVSHEQQGASLALCRSQLGVPFRRQVVLLQRFIIDFFVPSVGLHLPIVELRRLSRPWQRARARRDARLYW
jgi:hypothetical protein